MAELIDRKQIFFAEKLESFVKGNEDYREGFFDGAMCVLNAVDTMPTIEAKPVVHAHWEFMGYDDHGDSIYACTNCNYNVAATADHRPSKNIKYCPFCGAQMDEKNKTTAGGDAL